MALAVWQSTIVNRSGDVQASAQIEVRLESSGALAAIYADRDGNTALDNPFNADENGFARFYAAGGAYRIDATLGDVTTTYRHQSVGLLAEQDVAQDDQLYYRQTAAEIAAGNDPVSKQYPRNHILRFIPTSEHDAIYAGTSSYDASADAQDWLDSLQPGDEAVLVGVVRAQGLVLTKSDVTFSGGGWLRPISNSSTSAVLTIGSDSPSTMVRRIKGRLRLGGPSDGVSTWSNITGLELKQCVEADLGLDFRGLGAGWSATPSVGAVAYNQWHLGLVLNTKIGVLMNPSGTGYSNENTFWGGRFALNTGEYESGCIYIDIREVSPNVVNNNRFICPSFENESQIAKIAGTDNVIENARFESGASGTPGTDFAETFVELTGASARNRVEFSYNTELLSGDHSIDHGAATRVDDWTFVISGVDRTGYFYPGAFVRVTIAGTTHVACVRFSSFSTDTTVSVTTGLITGNPTAVVTTRITNTGSGNSLSLSRLAIPAVATMRARINQDMLLSYSRSSIHMSPRGGSYPALAFSPGGSTADYVFMVNDFDELTASLQCTGGLYITRFGLGRTPAQRQSAITAPTGGATQDAEARTAINSIITVLETFGLVGPN